ncbi:unnamed protein product [Natator depressus]
MALLPPLPRAACTLPPPGVVGPEVPWAEEHQRLRAGAICNPESFEYVKMIQQQIMENRAGGTREAPIIMVGNKWDQQKQCFMPRRTVSVLVKKSWKCGYMECSAKYNWHVVLLFKEMLSSVLARGCKHHHSTVRLQGALRTTRCSLM